MDQFTLVSIPARRLVAGDVLVSHMGTVRSEVLDVHRSGNLVLLNVRSLESGDIGRRNLLESAWTMVEREIS